MRSASRVLALILAAGFAAPAAADASLAALLARAERTGAALKALENGEPEDAALVEALAADAAALAALDSRRRAAAARAETLALDLEVRRSDTARMMAVLQAMRRRQPEAATLHPGGPQAAALAAQMLARIEPALTAEAARIGKTLRAIGTARVERDAAAEALRRGLPRIDAARADLTVSARNAVREVEVGPARESETLSALAAAFDAPGESKDERGPMALVWPAEGAVLGAFQARDAAGVSRPGIVLDAAPLALVQAPAAGVVRYAGPFLEYGYVVVLEPRAGTKIVLAGLAHLRVRAGESVEAGAVLGLLGGRPGDPDEVVKARAAAQEGTQRQTLYIEIRDDGAAVDPEPWFADESG